MSETQIVEKPKKAEKVDGLPVYDCEINVAKITRHIVPKTGVTAAELALLISQFGRGADGVDKIEEGSPVTERVPDGLTEGGGANFRTRTIIFQVKAELGRLREKYGPAIVKHVFGAGMSATIPRTLEDLNEMQIEAFSKKDEDAA